ncbi:FN3 associated domain-containing protein [uncultured Kordia sp.]|uniref:chitobiase/beta-hexosaminidase C-terminal domain-containing protein n=1 Tax=uncultured Kordia sp. TaxID=507699 RepID=UPI002632744D|nr:FN3 associated domain-containing protein [uncultured Kordia sp.]
MKENKYISYLFFGAIAVFGLLTFYALTATETPRIILFFGRFHPLLLHLPIGALLVAFFIDILGRIQKNYPLVTVRNILGFTSFFAILTCFLGYFLSLEGGYESDTLNLHLYTGIITACLTTLLFWLSLEDAFNKQKLFLITFVVSIVSISITGHYGSILTHGEIFLTEYVNVPETEKTIETVDSLYMYDNIVVKIFDKKCVQCHNMTKQKGELSLISPEAIIKGGETGKILLAGNAEASLLYQQLLLPISHEDHMPPEGKSQLTKDEIWLLKHWINEGLDFENHVTNTKENDTLAKLLKDYLVFNKVEIPRASSSNITDIKKANFRILELVPGEAELNVKYLNKTPNLEEIEQLSLLSEQIIELDFHSIEITDEMTKVIRELKNLKTLRINSKKVTDKTLQNLKKSTNLEVLNLYNTQISNQGLTALLQTIQPKKIYVWQTKVDEETAIALTKELKVNIQQNIVAGFVEESQLKAPEITPSITLFTDSIHVNITSRLKDVAIRYTTNGEIPTTNSTIVSNPIIIENSQTLKIAAFKKGWLPSDIITKEYTKVSQLITDFSIQKKPSPDYANPAKLFDLKEGSLSFKDGEWTGCFGYDLNTTIDLGSVRTVNNISFSTLEDVGSWILYPTKFTVFAATTNNGYFKKIDEIEISRQGEGGEVEMKKITLNMSKTNARFFKISIKNRDKLPKWHPAAGNPAWIFVDEIYVW